MSSIRELSALIKEMTDAQKASDTLNTQIALELNSKWKAIENDAISLICKLKTMEKYLEGKPNKWTSVHTMLNFTVTNLTHNLEFISTTIAF